MSSIANPRSLQVLINLQAELSIKLRARNICPMDPGYPIFRLIAMATISYWINPLTTTVPPLRYQLPPLLPLFPRWYCFLHNSTGELPSTPAGHSQLSRWAGLTLYTRNTGCPLQLVHQPPPSPSRTLGSVELRLGPLLRMLRI